MVPLIPRFGALPWWVDDGTSAYRFFHISVRSPLENSISFEKFVSCIHKILISVENYCDETFSRQSGKAA